MSLLPHQSTGPWPRAGDEPTAGSMTWYSSGRTVLLRVTEPHTLRRAARLVSRRLAAVERTCLRPDAEVHRLARSGGRTLTVSPMLAELVQAALTAAERTGGDVDPTVVGGDLAAAQRLSALPTCAGFPPRRHRIDWQDVELDGCRVTLPAGVGLDLRALGAAVGVDHCVETVLHGLGTGVLVALDEATASAGPGPERTRSGHAPSTGWLSGGTRLPAGTGRAAARPADLPGGRVRGQLPGERPLWAGVTVTGFSAREAQTYALAALSRGTAAPGWLRSLGVTAELVSTDGQRVLVPHEPRRVSR